MFYIQLQSLAKHIKSKREFLSDLQLKIALLYHTRLRAVSFALKSVERARYTSGEPTKLPDCGFVARISRAFHRFSSKRETAHSLVPYICTCTDRLFCRSTSVTIDFLKRQQQLKTSPNSSLLSLVSTSPPSFSVVSQLKSCVSSCGFYYLLFI